MSAIPPKADIRRRRLYVSNKLTFKLGSTQLTSDDRQLIQHALATAHD